MFRMSSCAGGRLRACACEGPCKEEGDLIALAKGRAGGTRLASSSWYRFCTASALFEPRSSAICQKCQTSSSTLEPTASNKQPLSPPQAPQSTMPHEMEPYAAAHSAGGGARAEAQFCSPSSSNSASASSKALSSSKLRGRGRGAQAVEGWAKSGPLSRHHSPTALPAPQPRQCQCVGSHTRPRAPPALHEARQLLNFFKTLQPPATSSARQQSLSQPLYVRVPAGASRMGDTSR